jgi:hypothetical protein
MEKKNLQNKYTNPEFDPFERHRFFDQQFLIVIRFLDHEAIRLL